jgi:hypothetical protein
MLDRSRADTREWSQGDPMSIANPCITQRSTTVVVDGGVARGRRGSVG